MLFPAQLILTGLLLLGLTAEAANWTFLRQGNQPGILADEDLDSFFTSMEDALDQLEVKDQKKWMSDQTGNHGSFNLLENFQFESLSCRKLGIRIVSGTRKRKLVHSFCRVDQDWQILK